MVMTLSLVKRRILVKKRKKNEKKMKRRILVKNHLCPIFWVKKEKHETKESKKEKFNFEESLSELESIVKELETGETPLDKAIEEYTKAMKLAKGCSEKINKATESVNKILKEDGNLVDFGPEG